MIKFVLVSHLLTNAYIRTWSIRDIERKIIISFVQNTNEIIIRTNEIIFRLYELVFRSIFVILVFLRPFWNTFTDVELMTSCCRPFHLWMTRWEKRNGAGPDDNGSLRSWQYDPECSWYCWQWKTWLIVSDKPLHNLNTPSRSARFRLSSRVHSPKSSIKPFFILQLLQTRNHILVNLCWTRSSNTLPFSYYGDQADIGPTKKEQEVI